MDNTISILVFILPGLLTYFWVNLFGITPSVKHKGTEMLAISALLWIPIVIVVLLGYEIGAGLSHVHIFFPRTNWFLIKRNWVLFKEMSDLKILSNNIWFLLYYVISSVLLSFCFAKFIAEKGYDHFLVFVNNIRIKNNKAPFSFNQTVWDELFINNEAQIVAISKLGDSDNIICGEIKNVSRPLEPERSISLRHVSMWQPIFDTYNIAYEEVFVDIKSGTIIRILNSKQALEARNLYLKASPSSFE